MEAQVQNESDFFKIGKYKVIVPSKGGLLGQGAFGKVYKGIDPETKQFVALKLIPKNKINRDSYSQKLFSREIEVQKQIRGKHVVNFIDLFEHETSCCIVAEFCNDGDLAKKIENSSIMQTKGVSENLLLKYFKDFIEGYRVLYDHKIIHRDIKPGNLLIHDGDLKIADFGLAKHIDTDPSLSMTLGVGSPIYMAPEVLLRTQYDSRSDIWSIGITLHEALFGDSPWSGVRSLAELKQVIRALDIKPYEFPGNPDSKFKSLLEGMLVFDVDKRVSWEVLFNYSFEKNGNTLDIDQLSKQIVNKKVQDDEGFKKRLQDSQSDKAGLTKSRIRIIEDGGNAFANRNALMGSRIKILEETQAPIQLSKTFTLLKEDHMSEEEMRALLMQEKTKEAFKRNRRLINHHIKIAQYLLYAYTESDRIFKANQGGSEDNNFFSKRRWKTLEGVFLKTACIILATLDRTKEENTLDLELWEEFIKSKEYAKESDVLKKIFKTFRVFFDEYKNRLADLKSSVSQELLSEEFVETKELKAYLADIEKDFVTIAYAILKGVGKNVKRDFLIVDEYVLNTLHWKEVFLPKKGTYVEIEKLLEMIQYEEDDKLYSTITNRIENRFKIIMGFGL